MRIFLLAWLIFILGISNSAAELNIPNIKCDQYQHNKDEKPSLFSILEKGRASNHIDLSKQIRHLLNSGADVNEEYFPMGNWSPLYYLLFYSLDTDNAINVRTVLEAGADINYYNKSKLNTLASAISSECNKESLAQLKALDEHKFNLNTRIFYPDEYYGNNPTLLMIEIISAINNHNNEHCLNKVKYILSHDVDINMLNYYRINDDLEEEGEANALFYALDFENTVKGSINSARVLEIVKLLIKKGINIKYKNSKGYDALYFLNANKNLVISKEYKELKVLLTPSAEEGGADN